MSDSFPCPAGPSAWLRTLRRRPRERRVAPGQGLFAGHRGDVLPGLVEHVGEGIVGIVRAAGVGREARSLVRPPRSCLCV